LKLGFSGLDTSQRRATSKTGLSRRGSRTTLPRPRVKTKVGDF
jgi:hypothetical protein